ncbi:MAG: hypothetical protein ACRC3B_15610, partial [Bacteroidia bacterium]
MTHRFLFLLLFISGSLSAQDFPGFTASPYSGIAGLAFNPATAADHAYSTDILLAGASLELGNNFAGFRRADIGKANFGINDIKIRDWNTRKTVFTR